MLLVCWDAVQILMVNVVCLALEAIKGNSEMDVVIFIESWSAVNVFSSTPLSGLLSILKCQILINDLIENGKHICLL